MNYASYEELYALIRQVIYADYKIAAGNVVYLEDLEDKSYVVYMEKFRDVVSHLSAIYRFSDPLAPDAKVAILEQLEWMKHHIEQIVTDSAVKICDVLRAKLRVLLSDRDYANLKVQLAMQITQLHLAEQIPYSERRDGLAKVIDTLLSAAGYAVPSPSGGIAAIGGKP